MSAGLVRLFLALAKALVDYAQHAPVLRDSAVAALKVAEQPAEDEDVLVYVEAHATMVEGLVGAYEALAKQLDEQHAGSLEWFFDGGVPIKAASLRLEARLAPFMQPDWLRHTAAGWEDVASTIGSAKDEANEGGSK